MTNKTEVKKKVKSSNWIGWLVVSHFQCPKENVVECLKNKNKIIFWDDFLNEQDFGYFDKICQNYMH